MPWLQGGGQVRLVGSASMDALTTIYIYILFMKFLLIILHVITSNLKQNFIKSYNLKAEHYKKALVNYTMRLVSYL